MKKLLGKLFGKDSGSKIEHTPAFVRFDINRTMSMVRDYARAYPEFNQECMDIIESLEEAISKNEVLSEKANCTARFDGV